VAAYKVAIVGKAVSIDNNGAETVGLRHRTQPEKNESHAKKTGPRKKRNHMTLPPKI
jgi:hypothetical protein